LFVGGMRGVLVLLGVGVSVKVGNAVAVIKPAGHCQLMVGNSDAVPDAVGVALGHGSQAVADGVKVMVGISATAGTTRGFFGMISSA
jgi:hypothetical protein